MDKNQSGESTPEPGSLTPAKNSAGSRFWNGLAEKWANIKPVQPGQAERIEVLEESLRVRAMREELLASVGARYRGCTMDNFVFSDQEEIQRVQRNILLRLRAMCERIEENTSAGRGVLFFGPAGTGKDHLMVATLRAAVEMGISVKWVSGVELYAQWRDAIGEDRSEHRDLVPLVRPKILAISDPIPPIGELTPHQAAKLFWLIDSRYRAGKPTWATLNVRDGKDAASRLTTPIVDRLKDGAFVFGCNWPSHRRSQ